jgi:hypothetical protein
MMLEDHELPIVEATALVRAGGRFDPADKVGLTDLGAEVMRTGGTQSLPGDALDDFLESRAAAIEAHGTEDLVQVNLNSLKADFPQVLKTFADVLRRPAFDAGKLEVAKNQAIANVSRQNDDPDQILFREFGKVIYGPDSPYARTSRPGTRPGSIRTGSSWAWWATSSATRPCGSSARFSATGRAARSGSRPRPPSGSSRARACTTWRKTTSRSRPS